MHELFQGCQVRRSDGAHATYRQMSQTCESTIGFTAEHGLFFCRFVQYVPARIYPAPDNAPNVRGLQQDKVADLSDVVSLFTM